MGKLLQLESSIIQDNRAKEAGGALFIGARFEHHNNIIYNNKAQCTFPFSILHADRIQYEPTFSVTLRQKGVHLVMLVVENLVNLEVFVICLHPI